MRASWLDLMRSLGEAFVELLGAEAEALKGDLSASGRRLTFALALTALAAFILFWAIGAAFFTLFQALVLKLPAWVAAGVVFATLLALGFVVGVIARQRFRAVESPADAVRRRITDHKAWWQENVLLQAGAGKSSDESLPPEGRDEDSETTP